MLLLTLKVTWFYCSCTADNTKADLTFSFIGYIIYLYNHISEDTSNCSAFGVEHLLWHLTPDSIIKIWKAEIHSKQDNEIILREKKLKWEELKRWYLLTSHEPYQHQQDYVQMELYGNV